MFRKVMNFRFLIILTIMLFVSSCNNKKDEIQELKIQLAETQRDLEKWQRKYDAVSLDNKNLRAAHRNLDTRLDDVDSSARTTEEQLNLAKQIIQELQVEIENRDATIQEMELIINDQEAALQEFLDMLGTTDGQIQIGY